MRRALLYVGGWLAAVVVATAVGFAAVSLVGDDVGAPGSAVALVGTQDPGDGPTAEPTSKPKATLDGDSTDEPASGQSDAEGDTTSTSAAVTQRTDSGTVTGRCSSTTPRLVSWSPNNGWSVASVDKSGSRKAVVFSDDSSFVTVALRCGSGRPTFSVTTTTASPSPEPTPTDTPTPTETSSVQPGNR